LFRPERAPMKNRKKKPPWTDDQRRGAAYYLWQKKGSPPGGGSADGKTVEMERGEGEIPGEEERRWEENPQDEEPGEAP
jgi:hypothetical protein